MLTPSHILLVGTDGSERAATATILADEGHRVSVLDNTGAALSQLGQLRPDFIVVDLAGGQDSSRLLRGLARSASRPPFIVILDPARPGLTNDALRLGAADVVMRPLDPRHVLATLENVAELQRLATAPSVPSPPEAEEVFAVSPTMRGAMELVFRVAAMRCSVLIVGEPGTGRDLVARSLHAHSPQRTGPFVRVPCSGADPATIDRLLSSRNGGPKSAPGEPAEPGDRRCALDSASGGVLFLKDPWDLPLPQQARLERRLAERRPSFGNGNGADRRIRLVSACDPAALGHVKRNIHPELFDRLSAVRIDVPPLCQRTQDIPILAIHLLKRACDEHGLPPKTFSKSALALLKSLPWPGNSRELKRLAQRLALLSRGGVVYVEDVLEHVKLDGARPAPLERESLKAACERFEREYVTAMLQHHHGRMGLAAQELGIERTNLYRKVKQLGINWRGGKA